MACLLIEPDVFRRTVQIGSDNVLPHSPIRQMVQRRYSSCERVWMLVRSRDRQPKTKVFRDGRHNRYNESRIVRRHLHPVTECPDPFIFDKHCIRQYIR